MIDFIICDVDKEFIEKLKNEIKKFMKNYNEIRYKIHTYSSYNKDFIKMVTSKGNFKVYFLEIGDKNSSGLDTARLIRQKYDDWYSTITIVTDKEEYRYIALGSKLFIFDFINKLIDFHNNIIEDLNIIIRKYFKGSDTLTFEYDYEIYKVQLKDIIYIEKEIDSKRCIIKTLYETKYITSSLNNIYEMLNSDFIKVSRSMIVNKYKIMSYNRKTNTLNFVDGTSSNLISREYKNVLKDSIKNS